MEDYGQILEETVSRITFCKDCVFVFVAGNKISLENWSCRNPKTFRFNVIDGSSAMRLCMDIRTNNLCEHFRSKDDNLHD